MCLRLLSNRRDSRRPTTCVSWRSRRCGSAPSPILTSGPGAHRQVFAHRSRPSHLGEFVRQADPARKRLGSDRALLRCVRTFNMPAGIWKSLRCRVGVDSPISVSHLTAATCSLDSTESLRPLPTVRRLSWVTRARKSDPREVSSLRGRQPSYLTRSRYRSFSRRLKTDPQAAHESVFL